MFTPRFWSATVARLLAEIDACARTGVHSATMEAQIFVIKPLAQELLDWVTYVSFHLKDSEGLVQSLPAEHLWYLLLMTASGEKVGFEWTESCHRLSPTPSAWHLWWYFVMFLNLDKDEEHVAYRHESTLEACCCMSFMVDEHHREALALAVDVLRKVCAQGAASDLWAEKHCREECLVNFGVYLVNRFFMLFPDASYMLDVLWDKVAGWPVCTRLEEDQVHSSLYLPIAEAIFVSGCASLKGSRRHVGAVFGRNPALIMCVMAALKKAQHFLQEDEDSDVFSPVPFPFLTEHCFFEMDFGIPMFGELVARTQVWWALDTLFFQKRDLSAIEPYLVHAVPPPLALLEAACGDSSPEDVLHLREVHARWTRWSCFRAAFVGTVLRARPKFPCLHKPITHDSSRVDAQQGCRCNA